VSEPADLKRQIGVWGGVAIIVGTVIGSGIFRAPASIARDLPDPAWTLALWAVVGVISLCGALTMAELATLLPRTGGTYVYLREAYGDGAAFVFGWLYLLAATPSGMGALAAAFVDRCAELAYGNASAAPQTFRAAVGVGVIAVFTGTNLVGVRAGSAVQSVLMVIKVAALGAIIAGTAFAGSAVAQGSLASSGAAGLPNVAAAVSSVLFTFNGWIYISLVAGEIEAPDRRLKWIIVLSMLAITAIYLSANAAYLYMLPVTEITRETFVAIRVMRMLGGSTAATVMGLCIMASILGALNGVVLTKSRVPYALSRDRLTFGFLGKCHPRWATPHVAILVQGAVAAALVLWLRSFDELTAYFVVVEWFALIFGIGAVFVLRRKMPEAPRPYRTPLYPWVPLIFMVGTTVGLAAIIWSRASAGNWRPVIGLGIALAGVPVYWIWRRVN
jgi:APA family basic amino acid/polyamine antiporter